jgi:hypothetical protein
MNLGCDLRLNENLYIHSLYFMKYKEAREINIISINWRKMAELWLTDKSKLWKVQIADYLFTS